MTTKQFNQGVQTDIDAKLTRAASHLEGLPHKEFTFLNVAITLTANSPAEAYTLLCNALATLPDADWQTDVYTNAEDVEGINESSTQELFPPAN